MANPAPVQPPPPPNAAPRPGLKLFLRLFLCAGVVYLVFFGGHWVMGDQAIRLAWAHAILDHHSNDISAYGLGVQYSKYGIGQSLLHIPFILLARAIQGLTGIHCEGPINMLPYVFNAALAVGLVGLILLRSGIKPRDAFWRALIIGCATIWFPYSKVEYGGALVATIVLATWLCMAQFPIISGLLAGAAVSIRMDALLWTVPTILLAEGRPRGKFKALAAMLPGIALTCWSNYARSGSLFNSGYEAGFINNPVVGLYGELFSAGKSLFLFSPLLILYPFILRQLYRLQRTRRLAVWSLILLAGQLLFYARWWDWSGDDAWGPRFLIVSTMAALVAIMAAPALRRWAFATLVAAGVALQLVAVLIGPHSAVSLTRTLGPMKIAGSMEGKTPITLDDMHFTPRYSQITATCELFLLKLGIQTKSADPALLGSSWLESFHPPLRSADVSWDIFWLNLRTLRHQHAEPASPAVAPAPPCRATAS